MFHCYYHPTGIVLIEEVETSNMDIDILMPILWEWLEFAVRWLHVITAISWIGTSFYFIALDLGCLLYTSPSPRDKTVSRMPSSA